MTTAADVESCLQESLLIRDDVTRLSQNVIQMRAIRKQLTDFSVLVKEIPKAEMLSKTAKQLVLKLDLLEAKFHNPKAEVTYDILAMKGGAQLYSQFAMLYDVVRDTNSAPTLPARERRAELHHELDKLIADYAAVLANELSKFNSKAKELDLSSVIVPPVKPLKESESVSN